MLVPLSWLREHADLPAEATGREVAERLIAAGLEVEGVDVIGADVVGPLVAGRVESVEEFTASNGKTIRFCQVDVGPELAPVDQPTRGIICGAHNFVVGDHVVVALPGAVLPGGFAIGSRKTYGHVSDGMICSTRELGIGDDHAGILVLARAPSGAWELGQDVQPELGLRDDVLDVAITPDRGYCMSIRGLARELATAYGVAFKDPAGRTTDLPGGGIEVDLRAGGCDRFVAVTVTDLDPAATSPLWMRARLHRSGIRPISLAVDVTNYVQLELGQPLHAYDAATLFGGIVVRDAAQGETVQTLDGAGRALEPHDVVITDTAGTRVIGVAGVMGGLSTEIGPATTEVVLEAAHFDPVSVSRTGRRLGLTSEAAKRFERGVDPTVQAVAASRAAELLAEHGGARTAGATDVGSPALPARLRMAVDHPDRVAGLAYGAEVVCRRLTDVGCLVTPVEGSAELEVQPPPWRPDLREPNDLAEEVLRLEGYANLPSVLPLAPAGRGLTERQRMRRRVGRALAAAGYVEVLPSPFVGSAVLEGLALHGGVGNDTDDGRHQLVRVANPISDQEPYLRPLLVADLLPTLRRNIGRGTPEVALFEMGSVFIARSGDHPADEVPRPTVARRPSAKDLARLDASLPVQPEHVAVVLAGDRSPSGWWGTGEKASWADAIEAARVVALAAGVEITVRAGERAPWHPGRCAAIERDGVAVGWAGELHPRVTAALDVPARTAAMELDLDLLAAGSGAPVAAPAVSTYPAAKEDLALVVESHVPAAEVAAAVRTGAGDLLEDLRLFDVYTGDQVGPGHKSLAFHLRLRAADRTLTADEAADVRDRAVREAAVRTGARLRT